jgi:glycosyltransferase involved in cell wall biosynthesis
MPKKIWLVTVGEPLPIEKDSPRLLRAGLLAQMLVQKGHQVTWWSSTVNHQKKQLHTNQTTTLTITENYKLILLHGCLYTKNISFKRLLNHYQVAREFTRLAPCEEVPDVILTSYPTIELAKETIKYGQAHTIPTVIDIRDFWPDIFYELFPKPLKSIAHLVFSPFEQQLKWIVNHCTHITGITPAAIDWALAKTGRKKSAMDQAFYLAYPSIQPALDQQKEAQVFWDNLGIPEKQGTFIACFIGSITSRIELRTVITAAHLLKDNPKIKFVICGQGETLLELKEAATGLPNIFFPGWVNQPQIWELLHRSHVGLLPYQSSLDFAHSIPNKVGEYLSAGLPVISSVTGVLKDFLADHSCGMTYLNHDAKGLAQIILDLVENHEKLKKMGKNAEKTYINTLSYEKVYTEYCQFLESLGNTER